MVRRWIGRQIRRWIKRWVRRYVRGVRVIIRYVRVDRMWIRGSIGVVRGCVSVDRRWIIGCIRVVRMGAPIKAAISEPAEAPLMTRGSNCSFHKAFTTPMW